MVFYKLIKLLPDENWAP